MKLLRLCAHQLNVNEPLPWNVRNEPGHLLLGKGFLLVDQAQIDALLARGVYVDQDEYEAHEKALKAAQARRDPFSLWANILQYTGTLLRGHKTNPNFAQDIGSLSNQIQCAMREDVDAGTFEMVNGDPHGYAVIHSLQTAFVASLASSRFGWTDDDRATLIRAALTMNISMLDLQNTLTQQTSPLTQQQKAEIAAHPSKGRRLLEGSGVRCEDWLQAVEQHHVTVDGKGLPQDKDHRSQLACMIHYADVYLAKLSPRASRPAMPVNVAARELFLKAEGAKNPYASAIIKEMGIFPPGSFVKLANGETAVVVRPGETANTPQVHSVISGEGWVFPESMRRDTARPEFKIVAAVPRGNVLMRLDRQKLFGYEAA
jgi:HD-GYP domain-containing protein (c-di-GMP phosphodiesterase class II)